MQDFVPAYLYGYHLWESVDTSRKMKGASHVESPKLQFPADSFEQPNRSMIIFAHEVDHWGVSVHHHQYSISIQIWFIAEAPWKWRANLLPTFPTSLRSSVLTSSSDYSLFRYSFFGQIGLFGWILCLLYTYMCIYIHIYTYICIYIYIYIYYI